MISTTYDFFFYKIRGGVDPSLSKVKKAEKLKSCLVGNGQVKYTQ